MEELPKLEEERRRNGREEVWRNGNEKKEKRIGRVTIWERESGSNRGAGDCSDSGEYGGVLQDDGWEMEVVNSSILYTIVCRKAAGGKLCVCLATRD